MEKPCGCRNLALYTIFWRRFSHGNNLDWKRRTFDKSQDRRHETDSESTSCSVFHILHLIEADDKERRRLVSIEMRPPYNCPTRFHYMTVLSGNFYPIANRYETSRSRNTQSVLFRKCSLKTFRRIADANRKHRVMHSSRDQQAKRNFIGRRL